MNRYLTYLLCCLGLMTAYPALAEKVLTTIVEDTAEQLLLKSLSAINSQEWATAKAHADQLNIDFPKFKLHGILQKHIEQQMPIDLITAKAITPGTDEFIPSNLQAEISLRWQNQLAPVAKDLLPSNIIKLSKKHPYILLVDMQKSRLYLLKNADGIPKQIANFYAGIGKQGIGKNVRGDHKTPIGVYNITEFIPDNKLLEIYGVGSYPINYPNAWDRKHKRTGSGIWLHGVPRNTYSRPPRSSRGCVTLSNHLFSALAEYVDVGNTPVILANTIEWLPYAIWQARAKPALEKLYDWQQAWESLDTDAYLNYYDITYKQDAETFQQWRKRKQAINANKEFINVDLDNIDIFQYPGETDLIQIQFTQDYKSNNYNNKRNKVMYWRKINNELKIVYEGKP